VHRFLFCPWGTRGALNPLLAVACELRRRGESIAFFSSPAIQRAILEQGFPWYPAPPEPPPPPGVSVGNAAHYLLQPLRSQLAALNDAILAFGPEAVVDGILPFAPRLLAESKNIPHASICTPACPIPSVDLFAYGHGLPPPRNFFEYALANASREHQRASLAGETRIWNRVRKELRLPEVEHHPWLAVPSSQLVVLPTSQDFEYRRSDLPSHVRFVGPLNWRSSDSPPLPDRLLQLAAKMPLVYVSQGTFFTQDFHLVRLALEALRDEPVAVAVSTGRPVGAGELRDLSARVVVRQSYCLWKLFEIASAAVAHGGMGGVNEALTAGLPLVLLPLGADQPEVAQRCVEAGVGIRLDVRNATPQQLRTAVRTLLEQPQFRSRAAAISSSYRRHRGEAEAADLLQQLAASNGARRSAPRGTAA
jgi:MGT family glycosyltransferase